MDGIGLHCLCELYDCPRHLLDDEAFVVQSIVDAAGQGMATLLNKVSHQFRPEGVTALALIAESHLAIHTWPSLGYAAIDAFTCGDRAKAEDACRYLVTAFQAQRHVMRKVTRGEGFSSEMAVPTSSSNVE